MAGPPVLNETTVGPPVPNVLGVCAMPVAPNPDRRPAKSGFGTTDVAQTPSTFFTGGPVTVSFNTGGQAISVALAFAEQHKSENMHVFYYFETAARADGPPTVATRLGWHSSPDFIFEFCWPS